uniref:glucuronosyltransferase n=1 Tax=Plectus sambesii TaxID=2011161 RepID=A0A914WMV5_9BILA
MFDYGDGFRVGFRSLAFKRLKIMTLLELGPVWFGAWNRACEVVLDDIEINGSSLIGQFDMALLHPMDICASLISNALSVGKSVVYSPGAFLAGEIYAYHSAVPILASYIPQSVTKFSDRMSTWERTTNTLLTIMHNFATYIDNARLSPAYQQAIYFARPPHNDRENAHAIVRQAVENMIINGFVALDFPRPLPVGFHHLSDLTLSNKASQSSRSPVKLEPEWERLLSSRKGAILFSFGTIAKSSEIPVDMKMAFLAALAKFTDYSIIWRYEEAFPEALQYEHIHLVSWLPQKDLLADERTKLFITHGGYNSLLESTKAGVPMVLIPLFVDQYGNAMRAVRLNIGVNVDKNTITAESFASAIDQVLNDQSFADRAKRMANILGDSLIAPDVALSHHLRTAAKEHSTKYTSLIQAQKFTFFDYHCADTLGILVLIIIVSCQLIY